MRLSLELAQWRWVVVGLIEFYLSSRIRHDLCSRDLGSPSGVCQSVGSQSVHSRSERRASMLAGQHILRLKIEGM